MKILKNLDHCKKTLQKIVFFLILFCTFMLILSKNTFAQQPFYIGISPPLLEVTIKPGKTVTQVYTVKNMGQETQIYADVVPAYPEGEQGKVKLDPDFLNPLERSGLNQSQHPYLSWFSLQNANIDLQQPFTLKRDEEKQLVLKIKVPENTPQKEFLISLIVRSYPSAQTNVQQVKTSGVIGSNIILTVASNINWEKKGNVDFSLDNSICIPKTKICFPIIGSFKNPQFKIKIANKGKFHFKPQGKLIIKNIFGSTAAEKELVPLNILPDKKREISCIEDEQKSICKVNTLNTGIYKAELQIDLANKTKTHFYFLVFSPFPLVVVVLILTYLIIKSYLRKSNT